MLDVRVERGVHLPAEGLWLDPGRSKKLAFVSHAHSDHVGRHAATIATPTTTFATGQTIPVTWATADVNGSGIATADELFGRAWLLQS